MRIRRMLVGLLMAGWCVAAGAQVDLPLLPVRPLNDAVSDNSQDQGLEVAGDGLGRCVAIWWTNRQRTSATPAGTWVVSRSDDDGVTWTLPAVLGLPLPMPGTRPWIAGHGDRWIVCWQAAGTDATGTDREVGMIRSDDGGEHWTAPGVLNSDNQTDGQQDWTPTVAVDSQGRWMAAWRRGTGGRMRLMCSTSPDGFTWTAPAPIETGAYQTSATPSVCADQQGRWVVAWYAGDWDRAPGLGVAEAVLFSTSDDQGASWRTAAVAAVDTTTSVVTRSPKVAHEPGLGWMATWSASRPNSSDEGSYDIFAAGSADGLVWGPEIRINTANLNQFYEFDLDPTVAGTADGRWVVAWHTWRYAYNSRFDTRFSISPDGGESWTSTRQLSVDSLSPLTYDANVRLVGTSTGGVFAAWESRNTLPGSASTDADCVMRRLAADTNWEAVQGLDPTAVDDGPGNDKGVQLAGDGAGRVLAVWQTDADLGINTRHDSDIWCARSLDGGQTWGRHRSISAEAQSDSVADLSPSLAMDAAGRTVVIWNAQTHIRSSHSVDAGETWQPGGSLLTPHGIGMFSPVTPHVATDGSGTWVAVWTSDDDAGGELEILPHVWTSRSTDLGATWTAGRWLPSDLDTVFGRSEFTPRIAYGDGVWVAAWVRSTDNENGQVLMCRSVDSGQTWSAPRTPSTSPSSGALQSSPNLATDGQGHWVMAWMARPTVLTNFSVWASRSADGGVTWSTPAIVPILNTIGQTFAVEVPAIATDMQGSWLVAARLSGSVAAIRSINNGATWASSVQLAAQSVSGPLSAPALSVDNAGRWAAVWAGASSDKNGTDADLYYTGFVIPDCNGNGVADALDITRDGMADCDGNQIPDTCDLSSGRRWDLNHDGVPDFCDCPLDVDGVTGITAQDLFSFLNFWFSGSSEGDFNTDGSVTVGDILDFVGAWFVGC